MNTDEQTEYYAINPFYTIEERHYQNGVAYAVVRCARQHAHVARTIQTLETYRAAERLIEALLNRKIH